ncbi:Nicolin-1 [Gryllus bimaculatus]|nr:Nicolin-1 [Gryllus bimaculatus]
MSVGRGHRRHLACAQGGARPKRLGREIVDFSVKGPVAVSLDEEQISSPGCSVIDLLFHSPSTIGEIVFRNYYTARVTVLVRFSGAVKTLIANNKTTDDMTSWSVAIRQKILMPNPHLETGSQDLFSIAATESAVEWNSVVAIRLILRQPSPVWRTFHVEELNVYRDVPRRASRPSHHIQSTSSIVHCQDYCSLLSLIRQQTLDALKWMPGSEQNPPRDSNSSPGYEFFNLPQA